VVCKLETAVCPSWRKMAPFLPPKVVVKGFKEKAEAITFQGKWFD
jgi:hypothetical protein